jgi:hypothetical protein
VRLVVPPTGVLVVVGVAAVGGVLVALGLWLSPDGGRQLARVGRATGLGRRAGVALYVATVGALASAVWLGDPSLAGRATALPLAVTFGGLFGLAVAASAAGERRRLGPERQVATGAADAGRAVVSGTVDPPADPTPAPFTGDPAVCWRVQVLERTNDPDRRSSEISAPSVGIEPGWDVEATEEHRCRFAVDDGSGPLAVDPGEATLRLDARRETRVEFPGDPPDRILDWVASTPAVGLAAEDRRYAEFALEAGEAVTVAGRVEERAEGVVLGGPDTLVVAGDPDGRRAELRRRVRRAGGLGAVATVAGYAGLLWSLGAL